MTHLEYRLKQRYGITGDSAKYIKFLVMTQGEKLLDHKNSAIYKINLNGVEVYALLSIGNKDANTRVVTTVYTEKDVERIKRMEVICE